MPPVEMEFPEPIRADYKWSLDEGIAWIGELNEGNESCTEPVCKEMKLAPSPEGTVPGFW